MKMTAAAAFGLLCLVGLSTMLDGEKIGELKTAARQFLDEISEKQLPDADVMEVSNHSVQVGTIMTEDRLTDAILKENAEGGSDALPPEENRASGSEPAEEQTPDPSSEQTWEPVPETTPEQTPESTPETTPEQTTESTPETTPEQTPESTPEVTPEPTPQPVSYTIQRGDTLIGICIKKYGSDARVAEICSLNNISNPDNIQEGQKILLPQP